MTQQRLPRMTDQDRSVIRAILDVFTLQKNNESVFWDICFCILAPQIPYKKNLIMMERLRKRDFFHKDIPLTELEELIKEARFKRKARYLIEAKKNFLSIINTIRSEHLTWHEKRDWIVKNVRGLGMKTASHLLRNLGARDFAIVDTHIIKYLGVEPPRGRKDYLSIEKHFKTTCRRRKLSPAELDTYIWKVYSGTPWEKFLF